MSLKFEDLIREKLASTNPSERPGSCLIIQTSFIGDVILATPLIEKLKRFYPNCEIDFLVRKGNEGLLESHPKLREVLVFDKRKKKYQNLYHLIRKIREKRYDVTINIQRYSTTGVITLCSASRYTVGFAANPLSRYFTKKIKHEMRHKVNKDHEVTRNLRLIEFLTDNSFEMPKLYPVLEKHKPSVDTSTPYFCIAPSSVWFTKQYPVNNWIRLIDALPKDHTVYLLGAKGDSFLCNQIVATTKHPKVVNVAGELSLLQSASLMGGAAMNYVNDSAPLHLTSAMNAPVRAMFCSTVPAFGYTPLSSDSKVIENLHQLKCRPCNAYGKKACPEGHFKCGDITTDQIINS